MVKFKENNKSFSFSIDSPLYWNDSIIMEARKMNGFM